MSLAPLTAITGIVPGDPATVEVSGESLGSTGPLDTDARPSGRESRQPDFAGIMLQALAAPPPQDPTETPIDLAQLHLLLSGDGDHEADVADGASQDPVGLDTALPGVDHTGSTAVETVPEIETRPTAPHPSAGFGHPPNTEVPRPEHPPTPGEPVRSTERPPMPGEPVQSMERPSMPGEPVQSMERPPIPGEPVPSMERPPTPGESVRPTERPSMPGEPVRPTERPAAESEPMRPTERPPVQGDPVRPTERPPMPGEPVRPTERPPMPGKPVRPTERPPMPGKPVRPTERPPAPQTVPQFARADRAIEKLDLELAIRIRRVAERMLVEHGHEVEMVEGYRSPERQQFLFAQGRTAPGNVVTWTQQSLHSQGRAADLQIDGTWENDAAYRVLQHVAEEEGLSTIGMRDPGHIQLAGSPGRPAYRADADAQTQATVVRHEGSMANRTRMAAPARVAAIAALARVAQVAAVAPPGASIDARRVETTPTASTPSDATTRATLPTPASLPTPESPKISGIERIGADGAPSRADGAPSRMTAARGDLAESNTTLIAKTTPDGAKGRGTQDNQEPKASRPLDAAPTLAAQPARLATPADPIRGAAAATPVDSSSGAERVARVQTLQDLAAPGRVHVSLDAADGAGTRINLTMRGSAVDASIHLEDPATARHLNSRIAELHSALKQRGLEPASLRVQPLPPRAELIELPGAPRPSAADAPVLTSEAEGSSQRHPNGQSRETLRDPREEPHRFQQRPKRNPESEAKQ